MPRPSDIILDHCKNPRNAGTLASPDGVGETDGRSPSIRIEINVQDGVITDFGFSARGCGYMISAGSVLSTLALGSRLREVKAAELIEALGGVSSHKQHCPELAVKALQLAIVDYQSRE